MKIQRIDLRDFRQFHGHEKLELAVGDERNVTLIHAENGVGKTTLLNAVYWTLFGRTTARFEQKNRLVNFEAQAKGCEEASVEVVFEFDGVRYRAVRRHRNGVTPQLTIYKDLEGTPLKAPETFVGSVLPEGMAPYFFFDGEHAESFAGEQNRGAGAAIRSMLGCDLAEKAMQDLKDIAASYTRAAGSVKIDEKIEAQRAWLAVLEDQQETDRQALRDLEEDIQTAAEQKAIIEEQLRRTAGAQEIQKLRDELVEALGGVQKEIAGLEASLVRWVGDRAMIVVARKLAEKALDFIDEEQLNGRLPSPYNESFIRGLLTKRKCICCEDLVPETEQWNAVAALLQNAGTPGALNKVVRARARLQNIHEEAKRAPGELVKLEEDIAARLERRRTLEQRIGEEGKKLENYSIDEVRERERARALLEETIRKSSERKGSLSTAIADRQVQIDDESADIEAKVRKNERAKVIFGKRRLALDASTRLACLLAGYETQARREIEDKINEFLGETARRDYEFRFSGDFGMSLMHRDIEGPVPKSGGENQLMSLAFTAALVGFAKSRVGVEDAILTPGTVAPLVLDAPIGHLDHAYRRAVAEFLPRMSGQVVLLLSSAHTGDGVLEALRPRVGAEYVLVSENRAERGGRGDDAIDLGGRRYERSLFGQEINRTRIERVA